MLLAAGDDDGTSPPDPSHESTSCWLSIDAVPIEPTWDQVAEMGCSAVLVKMIMKITVARQYLSKRIPTTYPPTPSDPSNIVGLVRLALGCGIYHIRISARLALATECTFRADVPVATRWYRKHKADVRNLRFGA